MEELIRSHTYTRTQGRKRTGNVLELAGHLLAAEEKRERIAARIRVAHFADFQCVINQVEVHDLLG